MYSKRLFTVASTFKAGGMNVLHYYSVLETESFARNENDLYQWYEIICKYCFPYVLYHQFACERIRLYSQFAYYLRGMTPVVDDTELAVCSNCVTQPQGTETKVAGVYGTPPHCECTCAGWVWFSRMCQRLSRHCDSL